MNSISSNIESIVARPARPVKSRGEKTQPRPFPRIRFIALVSMVCCIAFVELQENHHFFLAILRSPEDHAN